MEDVIWAQFLSKRPFPRPRPQSLSQRKGLAYEYRFGRHLRALCNDLGYTLRSGSWIEFLDENGPGIAQPDHLVKTPDCVWIFENKLTYREEGWAQLVNLYSPLVKEIEGWGLPQVLVQVVRNLSGADWRRRVEDEGSPPRLSNLKALGRGPLLTGGTPRRFLLHWLGIQGVA